METDLIFYEKTVPNPKAKRNRFLKVLVSFIGAFLILLWIFGATYWNIHLALIFALSFFIFSMTFVSVRHIGFEYEYSITDSLVTLAKIYGKSKRKEIFEIDSDNVLFIAPATEDNLKKAKEFKIKETYSIYGKAPTDPLWLIAFEYGDANFIFIFEASKDSIKLLKALKPSVISYR